MKNRRYLMTSLALALAGALWLAGGALAQTQGNNPGVCPAGQGKQLCTGGPNGTCTINPSQTPAQANCPAAGKYQKRQGMKGPQGRGQAKQPSAPAPASNQ